ncbi:unnamed protein product [Caenorhabditis bovis]|uniref:Protein-lysine N-methyltransferase CBOVIS_LOCUS4387 n=1 Tax=Caenorhabditis bovis TaxID=2654633 RepID=A0A8S1EUR9_9PELO|nr:unnamed protein product [Caenorhabditis bovis]
MSDDEMPELSSTALAALAEFREEERRKNEELLRGDTKSAKIDEDWQLSQFWYDEATSRRLVDEALATKCSNIACVSSPTLMQFFHETQEYKNGEISLKVFEFDTRFGLKFPDEFVFYDYKKPTEIPKQLLGAFDLVIADPPFLAAECLIKTSHTVRLIGKPDVKVILCTGAIMDDYASRLLGMHRTSFEPHHANNLANDFACFANYPTKTL